MKKIISLALVIAMVFTMSVTAFATESGTTEKNITLGATALQGAQKSNVYYGNYQQSEYTPTTAPESPEENTVYTDSDGTKFVFQSNKQKYFKIDPIKWRVLANGDGKLFLLADQNLDVFKYNTMYVNITWETSTMRSWLNGYGYYTSDNFIKTAFSTQELAYILQTTLENADNPTYDTEGGNDTNDHIFLLSIAEVTNTAYGFTADTRSTNTRVSTDTAYVAAGGKLGTNGMYGVGVADCWWLRSPGKESVDAAYVDNRGNVDVKGYAVDDYADAVRPAFNLKSTSVLFTSAAKDGKTSFAANADLASSEGYKLTVLDTSRSTFSAELFKTADKTYVKYQGATTGANEHITAMIVNANGDVTYYGSLKNITETADASGTIDIDLSGMNSGDKVYILNEQWNGDYKTDYASALKEPTIYKEIENNSGTTTVNYGVSESYTATIPADITLSASRETDVEVKTSSMVVEYGKELTISVSSDNYSESKWYLVDSANTSNKLEYSIKNGENDVTSGDTVLTVAAGTTEEQKVTLKAKLSGNATYSGTYKDTLTFTVSIASASGGTTETWTTVTDEDGLRTALQAGGKIKFGDNITATNISLNSKVNAELDLNGKTLTVDGITIPSGYTLTVLDSSTGGTGKIVNSSTSSSLELIIVKGSLDVRGGTISSTLDDCAIHLGNDSITGLGGSATISGGSIESSGTYGAVYVSGKSTLTVSGGTISCTASNEDAIRGSGATTVTGGTFSSDPSTYVDADNYTVTDNGDGTYTVTAK